MNGIPERRVYLSLSNLLAVLAVILSLIVLWQVRSLIVLVMISIVLASTIAPIVDWAERWRVPRWLTVLLVYAALIGGLTGFAVLYGPTAFTQIERITVQLPNYLRELVTAIEGWALSLNDSRPELVNQIERLLDVQGLSTWALRSSQQVLSRSFSLTTGLVGGVVNLVLALFVSGYMLADSRTLSGGVVQLLPQPWDERMAEQIAPVSSRIGSYLRGRVLVSLILAVLTTLGLSVLGLSEYALGLGAIAGITNLIPFVGPILGAVPALIVALSQGWWTLLWVLVLFLVLQNLESYLLAPLVVGSSVGVHPLYLLLAVLAGTEILGIIGALIVPPLVAGAGVLLQNLYLEPKRQAEAARTGYPAEQPVESLPVN